MAIKHINSLQKVIPHHISIDWKILEVSDSASSWSDTSEKYDYYIEGMRKKLECFEQRK